MINCIPLVLSLFVCLAGGKPAVNTTNTINPVIGDISYVKKYGHPPTLSTTEDDRIKTHLEYVEQLLLSKDVSQLREATKQRRMHIIALLHEYHTAGKFPKNYDHPGRKPCFIDKDGSICAVGYLVEQTAGLTVAENINAKHQYDDIEDMNIPELAAWVSTSGLTKEECAMIQPTYGWKEPPQRQIAISYSLSTSILTGANVAFTGVNIHQSIAGKKSTTIGVIGLATGCTQALLGALNLDDPNFSTSKERTASQLNIAMGSVTLVSSLFNLIIDKKPRIKNTSVSLNSFSTVRNEPTVGFTLTRKL